jgi:hypothetical protein
MGTSPSPFDDHALLALQYAEQARCRETTTDFVFALELAVECVRRGLDSSTLDKARYRELSPLFRYVGRKAAKLMPNGYDREMIEASFGAIQHLLTLWQTPPARRPAAASDCAFDPHACVRQFNDDLKAMRKAHAAERLRLLDAKRAAALARRSDEDGGCVVIPFAKRPVAHAVP